MYTTGEQVGRIDLALPADVPYSFAMLPQYETERILAERLAELGTSVERGVGIVSVEQDADGVTATTSDSSIDRVRYVIGERPECDAVRVRACSPRRMELGARAVDAAHGLLDVYLLVASYVTSVLPVVVDTANEVRSAYGVTGPTAFVIRPDGYLGHRGLDGVIENLKKTFAL
ncbi:FAD-dependent monooxygenase [Rhodococcus sp. 1168]|uniref:FAD-dependent monooxygenase n=1 Tax=Rhodococcus sp. 1168 TaxID=2018041 RepID=UPI000A09D3E3|nr:FAD-dependent monooxygenase [Rhodococcus sp. 1168]ORI21227.1 hypothetical protein BJI47_17525 [Rhodococcus sp. 1168]